jgi:[citrate (pro-3S)-lyase] ligase
MVVVVGFRLDESFQIPYFKKSCEENGLPVYDSQPDYDRPHDMGEVFLSESHPNANGNKKTAEIIFDKLFVHSAKLPMPDTFKHYFRDAVNSVPTYIEQQPTWAKDELSANPDFLAFIRNLETYRDTSQVAGTIVMNCNPFTLGHLYLAETAAAQVDKLYIFVVEVDKSEFPFADRFELVKSGTAHLPNVTVLPSSQFIISGVTLPEYFVKGENQDAHVDASMALEIFGKWIAPAIVPETTLEYLRGKYATKE